MKKNNTSKLSEVSYQEFLKDHAECYVQIIARKYQNDVAEFNYEDLCQEGRLKLWHQYKDHREHCPEISILEAVKIFKTSMENLCKDLQRKMFFAECRNVNKTIDLDQMLESVENDGSRMPDSLLEFFTVKTNATVLDFETKELIDTVKIKLEPLASRILDELMNPSEELIQICQSDDRKRLTYQIHMCYLEKLLDVSYGRICEAFEQVKEAVRLICDVDPLAYSEKRNQLLATMATT